MPKAKKGKSATRVIQFEATLERMRSRLNWTIVHVPFDAKRAFGVGGQIKVKGEINRFPFRTSLFPAREGRHILLVNKRMQQAAHVRAGGRARFALEFDADPRIASPPLELDRILAENRSFRRWYDGLNHSTRIEIGKWIHQPKSSDARGRRAEQMAERLLSVMEAERELPPVLQVAFARDPQAWKGWELMSSARRRSHLLGIFYYRTPEGRANRISKMLEDALAISEKKGV